MATQNEIQRLAQMANALRPDWPVNSLATHLGKNHGQRSYRDLAVAIAWIATDPQTKTPARLAENGPWWKAATVERVTATGQTQRCPVHKKTLLRAGTCPECEKHLTRNRPANFEQTYQLALREARAERERLHQEAMNHE